MSQEFFESYNKLQQQVMEFKLHNDINFPQLVVIGEQSSGKSTLLNALSGKNFLPQGQEMVTRSPIVIQMTTIKDDDVSIYMVNGHLCNDFKDIRNKIKEVTDEIPKNEISTNPINVTIKSQSVPTFSLVDLPGLVSISLAWQDKNIVKDIETLAQSYIHSQNTIILAVIPASSDVANSNALRLAKQVDPEGSRTLGIMTKLDLLDGKKGLKFFSGGMIEPILQLGYFGVRCKKREKKRDESFIHFGEDSDDPDSAEEYDTEEEDKFFRDGAGIFGDIIEVLGVKNLRVKVQSIFADHIGGCFEKILNTVEEKIEELTEKIKEFGVRFETDSEKKKFISSQVENFVEQFQDFIENKNYVPSEDVRIKKSLNIEGGVKVRHIIDSVLVDYLRSYDILNTLTDHDIRARIINSSGISPTFLFDENCFKKMLKDPIKSLERPSLLCLRLIKEELRAFLKKTKLPEIKPFAFFQKKLDDAYTETLLNFDTDTEKLIKSHIDSHSCDIDTEHPKFLELTKNRPILVEFEKRYGIKKEDFDKEKTRYGITGKNKPGLEGPKYEINLDTKLNDQEINKLVETKFYLDCYMKTVVEDFCTNIPRKIRFHLVNNMKEKMASEIREKLLETDYDQLLKVDNEKTNKRNKLVDQKRSLEKCMDTIREIEMEMIRYK